VHQAPQMVLATEDALAVLLNVVPELPGETVGPLYTTNRTLLILVPTHLHQPISKGSSEGTLPWRGLVWGRQNLEIVVSC
jgi:hypothetical protein